MFGTIPFHLRITPDTWPFELCESGDQEELPPFVMPERVSDSTFSLPSTQSTSMPLHRLESELQALLMTDVSLARDLAYFGDSKFELIVQTYGLSIEALQEKMADKDFLLLVKTLRKDMEKDANGMVRGRAKLYLDAEMELMHEIVINRQEKTTDRLTAFKTMAQLADAMPRNEPSLGLGSPTGPAANIVFNFGNNPFAQQLGKVIESAVEQGEIDA